MASTRKTYPNTVAQDRSRLARLRVIFEKCLAEARRLPEEGNGFATRAEMIDAVYQLYGDTIRAIERRFKIA